jgi:NADH-quinone oxidoreductase subunit A
MNELIPILFLGVFVLFFGIAIVVLTGLLGPKPIQSETKKRAYECGLEGQETGHSKIPVKYYLTAILFILFDIEIIFMYPWAITFSDSISDGNGLQWLIAMGVFIAVFIVGLIWEIKSKALEWE